MSWAHPLILYLIPAALLGVWWIFRSARGANGPSFEHIRRLWADRRGLSDNAAATRRRVLRGICLAAAVSAALLALARPQWGAIAEESFDQSREVMLALDLSRSMLADDVSPNRLARAKLLIEGLLDQLKGERVGLIVFSGTAFVQSPLSADYEVLRDFLTELDPSYLPEGGTDYDAMLHTAVQAFGQQGEGDRYLVVLSDGEAFDENWQKQLPALRERGIRVIGLGVGTPAGALVPNGKGGVLKDEHGAAVLSRLEPRTLQQLAAETDGTYRDAATWVDIAELVTATVEQGRKGRYVEQRNVRLQDHFQLFLAPALFFLLLSYWLEFPVSPLARALPKRGRRPHPASSPAFAVALMALAAWHSPRLASAAVPDTLSPSGAASQPNQLTATVAELSSRPQLAAVDYAWLASDTIAFASQPTAPTDRTRANIIDDALAAVDRGEISDAHAADWPTLRKQLEQLKQVKQEPPQKPQPNDKQKSQKQDQQKGQSQKDQSQNQQGQGGQQDQQNQSGQSGQQEEQKQNGQQAEPNQSNSGADQQQQKQNGQGGQQQANDTPQGSKSDDGKDDKAEAGKDQQASKNEKGDDDKPAADSKQASGSADRPRQDEEKKGDEAAAADAAKPDTDQSKNASDDQHAAGGEVKRQDEVKPLAAREAGLGEQDQPAAQKDAQPAAPQNPTEQAQQALKPGMRMVGGGQALKGLAPDGDTALAEAIGKMERVKDGDAPAVLFDRMNRAEGQPRPKKHSKDW
jgi:Ca-activated chloride channel family protein